MSLSVQTRLSIQILRVHFPTSNIRHRDSTHDVKYITHICFFLSFRHSKSSKTPERIRGSASSFLEELSGYKPQALCSCIATFLKTHIPNQVSLGDGSLALVLFADRRAFGFSVRDALSLAWRLRLDCSFLGNARTYYLSEEECEI